VNGLLSLNNRTITPKQMKDLLESASFDATALYLTMSIRVAQQWESYCEVQTRFQCQSEYSDERQDCLKCCISNLPFLECGSESSEVVPSLALNNGLAATVKGLINQIFDRLENDYGKLFTRFAVGVITFSRAGDLN
jgi:hypothetical protein